MTKAKTLILLLAVLLLNGCSTLDPKADAILVRAQQTRSILIDTVNAYLKYEYENHVDLQNKSPKYQQVADFLRKQTPVVKSLLDAGITGYASVKNTVNKIKLNDAETQANSLIDKATHAELSAKGQ